MMRAYFELLLVEFNPIFLKMKQDKNTQEGREKNSRGKNHSVSFWCPVSLIIYLLDNEILDILDVLMPFRGLNEKHYFH